ncbi:Uncharacterised protein [Nocardia farcinica]|uniref:Lipoprotein n=1 Tax=Nocardia farcinica TaxID=37329 RepID=A0A449GDC7_NOCFR|nr:hypothetical protein [Nocardia farcinica]SUE28618.1 lipoprotein [Nocardia farcinica]VFA96045.1 Uncharacterised protein [Nocardia farcinica]
MTAPSPRRRAFSALPLAAACALLAACGNALETDQPAVPATPTDPGFEMTIAPPSSSVTDVPDPDQISPEAATALCDTIRADLDSWRDQGSIIARVSFNGAVHNWAVRNGGLNDAVVRDRSVVDTATTTQCPDVRDRALEVLDVPDLAAALAGF